MHAFVKEALINTKINKNSKFLNNEANNIHSSKFD